MGNEKQERAAQPAGETAGFEIYEYPVSPGSPTEPAWEGWLEEDEEAPGVAPANRGKGDQSGAPAGEAASRLYEEGRLRGCEEGRELERAAQAAARKGDEERRKRQMGALVESFARERDRFLAEVEQEVVKLALAVSARILRREAQMDPLLLSGAVRVALGQLAGTSEVKLRVPEAEVELWREAIALFPNLSVKPEVAAGEGMRLGDCLVESKAGSVDLGVRAQLGEIERCFFECKGPQAQQSADAGAAARAKGDR